VRAVFQRTEEYNVYRAKSKGFFIVSELFAFKEKRINL
jgi:hypothetical protein